MRPGRPAAGMSEPRRRSWLLIPPGFRGHGRSRAPVTSIATGHVGGMARVAVAALSCVLVFSLGVAAHAQAETQGEAIVNAAASQAGMPYSPNDTGVACSVPNLVHQTLKQAERALTRAHCRLGKVRRPKHVPRHHVLWVASQSTGGERNTTPTTA